MAKNFVYLKFDLKSHKDYAYLESLARYLEVTFSTKIEYEEKFSVIKILSSDYEKLIIAIKKDYPLFQPDLIDKSLMKEEKKSRKKIYLDVTENMIKKQLLLKSEANGCLVESEKYFLIKKLLDDLIIKNLRKLSVNLREYQVPSIVGSNSIIKTGYIDKFSDIVLMISKIHQETQEGSKEIIRNEFLSPTVCFRIFPFVKDIITQKLSSKNDTSCYPICITSKAQCFRNERRSDQVSLMRLNEFCMREYVFIGSEAEISILIEKFNRIVSHLLKNIYEFDYSIEDANDAFFIGAFKTNSKFQTLLKLKQEYVIQMDRGPLSFISINNHKESMLKSFDLLTLTKKSLEKPCSACIGIGLDRLMLILYTLFDMDDKLIINKLEFLLKS